MIARKALVLMCACLGLSLTGLALANDNEPGNNITPTTSDLSRLSDNTAPVTGQGLKEFDNSHSREPGSTKPPASINNGKVAVNQAELSKAMIGKFRINGI
jgi:hypothetical protein